jgi:hypothetical protein
VYSEVNTRLTIDASGISNPPNRPRDDPWRWLQLQRLGWEQAKTIATAHLDPTPGKAGPSSERFVLI